MTALKLRVWKTEPFWREWSPGAGDAKYEYDITRQSSDPRSRDLAETFPKSS